MMDTITYNDQNNRTYTYGIACLKGGDVLTTRPLWEEVFCEDSPAFTEYYFQKKARHNTTFICRLLSAPLPGEIVSMVHLTPYEITIEGNTYPSFYIVGVATKESHRHRGLMAALLNRAFKYAESMYCPFVFLMPANPAIYKPFGFSYVYSRPQYDVPRLILQKEVYINSFPLGDVHIHCLENTASDTELERLSTFACHALKEQFDYYLTRTPAYYETLLAELASQKGCIFVFTLKGKVEGYFLYTEEENTPFIQELLFSRRLSSCLQDLCSRLSCHPASHKGTALCKSDIMSTYFPIEQPEKKPIIMAKNLNSSQHDNELSAASHSVSHSLFSGDYVNYLLHHNGCINEIV